MRYLWITIVLMALILFAGCSNKDPEGLLAQISGALQYGNHAQAFAYAARHGEKTTYSLGAKLIKEVGKQKACKAMDQAVTMLYKEYYRYNDKGNITEYNLYKEAHTRMKRVEFDLCR